MPRTEALRPVVLRGLRAEGFARVAVDGGSDEYRELAESLGEVVGVERIALRPGAHAYVAKPGPVPLHTDQPQVDVIGWHCIEQDSGGGASLLLDTAPVVAGLDDELRATLEEVRLMTPPLQGGPPSLTWPVLRRREEAREGHAVFCSPWLRSAEPDPRHQQALDELRGRLSAAIRAGPVAIRMAPGEALFVDNTRVLHGRAAIGEQSRRCLLRVWVRRSGALRS